MSKAELRNTVQEIPNWLVQWEKELLEKRQASLITVDLETRPESIIDSTCDICNGPTVKTFVPHSVVSENQKLIIGTTTMPGYRCEECRDRPDIAGRAAYLGRSFGRDVSRVMKTREPGLAGRLLYTLRSYARDFPGSIIQKPTNLDSIYYLSKEGLFEFNNKAADIFEDRGYTKEANIFRQLTQRDR